MEVAVMKRKMLVQTRTIIGFENARTNLEVGSNENKLLKRERENKRGALINSGGIFVIMSTYTCRTTTCIHQTTDGPPPDHRRTTTGPPPDHRRTTAGPPPDNRRTTAGERPDNADSCPDHRRIKQRRRRLDLIILVPDLEIGNPFLVRYRSEIRMYASRFADRKSSGTNHSFQIGKSAFTNYNLQIGNQNIGNSEITHHNLQIGSQDVHITIRRSGMSIEQQTERESSDDGTKNANSETSKHQGNSNVDPGEAFINNVQASCAEDKTIIMEVSSDEEVTDLIKKRKAAYPLEGGSTKKQKNILNIAKIMKDWGVSFEDAVIFAEEHRKVELNNRILERDSAYIKRKLKDMGTFEEQIEVFNRFKRNVKVKESALTRLERAKYRNIEKRRVSIDEISITITRRDPKGGIYTEVAYVTRLGKYGYIEWMQMLKCIEKQKGKNAVELREALNRLITKVKGLGLIAADKAVKYPSSASVRAPATGRIHDVNCLLPFGTVYINNTLPVGVHPVQHLHITHPEQGMFYMDGGNQMCFQRAAELSKAPTEHLSELRLECMGHIDLQKGFHLMISMELYKRKDELKIDKFQYVKPEIESDVIEFWTRAREVLGQDLLRTHIFPRTRELPQFPISPKPLFLSKNRLRNPPKPVLKQNKKLCTYAQKKSLHICKVFGKKKVVFSEFFFCDRAYI
ncbi:hypothetical protein LXL04_008851 [Taraxacum kok-saghyz]